MPLFHDPATAQAVAMRSDWLVFTLCAIGVALLVWLCIFYALWRWREREGSVPARFKNNPPLEITYTLIPIALVVALFAFVSDPVEQRVDRLSSVSQVVDATAFRWSWMFAYPSAGVTITGTPQSPPTLLLPQNETTEIDLRSADVTHSFWVPGFLFKRDAIPGMINRFDLTPTRLGSFRGLCAQFCGMDHAFMTFTVRVVPAADFQRDLLARKDRPA